MANCDWPDCDNHATGEYSIPWDIPPVRLCGTRANAMEALLNDGALDTLRSRFTHLLNTQKNRVNTFDAGSGRLSRLGVLSLSVRARLRRGRRRIAGTVRSAVDPAYVCGVPAD